jgi:flavin reductase (DIM6/NTAB) family NADH-FMN oxidoreductase RutF
VTTASGRKKNIMTLTWHMVLDFSPQIACVIGPWDYTFNALSKKKECVLAIPAIDLAAKAVDIGSCSGSDTDKFKTFDLELIRILINYCMQVADKSPVAIMP